MIRSERAPQLGHPPAALAGGLRPGALTDFKAFHLAAGLDLLDALIGFCAVGHGATPCTFHVKRHRSIAGLQTEQPYTR